MNLCTLFDSNYIDRALVMYDSLIEACDDFSIYVIAFDNKCYEVLTALNLSHMIVVPYWDFEDDTLRKAKSNRNAREFLWTCSGYCIRYFLQRFNLSDLTYIDSDLFFYESPKHALTSFLNSDCDVAIISHRYSKHPENDYNAKMYGQYCVQFNSFKSTPNGLSILDWWIERCIECCTENATDELFGDQKYLDQLYNLFDGVYIYKDFGMGIAPWNIDEYKKTGETEERGNIVPLIMNKRSQEYGRIIFYHFHSIDIFPDGSSNIRVFIRPGRHDRYLVESVYTPYIHSIISKRKHLNEEFSLFDNSNQNPGQILHKSEIKMFFTCEPNLIFLVRKIWRYLLHKRKDYIKISCNT